MKKTYPTSKHLAGSGDSRARHLRKRGKRVANKGTRKTLKLHPMDLLMQSSDWGNRPS